MVGVLRPSVSTIAVFAGERLDPDTYHWASQKLGIPVIDHCWQTETGWAIAANPLGVEALAIKPGSPAVPMPGYAIAILHPDGSGCGPGEEGAVCLSLPLPPGTFPTLWLEDARFEASYLCERRIPRRGRLSVRHGADDVINVAGHRLSTGAMERCWRLTRRWPNAR
jgi:propionyl-CoA synthetase